LRLRFSDFIFYLRNLRLRIKIFYLRAHLCLYYINLYQTKWSLIKNNRPTAFKLSNKFVVFSVPKCFFFKNSNNAINGSNSLHCNGRVHWHSQKFDGPNIEKSCDVSLVTFFDDVITMTSEMTT